MTKEEIIKHLKTQDAYQIDETEGAYNISWRGNKPVVLTNEDLVTMDLGAIEHKIHDGHNVEHITRVTGYFSKTNGWNKGKVAELIDRHRTPVS